MSLKIWGIHHVTAITADARKNIDFYSGTLGLRLVKVTVNFDDPGSYHLYYGDQIGRPGTIMTFFVWPRARRGQHGPPQITAAAFGIPAGSFDQWLTRLKSQGVSVREDAGRFGERLMRLVDPDGLPVEVVELAGSRLYESYGPLGADSIVGFHSVTIAEERHEETEKLLTEDMGFAFWREEGTRRRYINSGADIGNIIDVDSSSEASSGVLGAGVVHHLAFRTPESSAQESCQEHFELRGINVSPIMDRRYFHSIYFREPGGVLFEIATDGPGFSVDEGVAELGSALRLPPHLEEQRERLLKILPGLEL